MQFNLSNPTNMKRICFISLFVLTVLLPLFCSAKDLSEVHTIGIRMGFWNAVQADNADVFPGQEVLTKKTASYGEFYICAGLRNGLVLEFSAGSCFRGETRFHDSYGSYWQKVTIYPLTGELKYYPFSSLRKTRWQPYLDVGLGFVSGIENLRLGEYAGPLLYVDSYTNSYLTFGWHAGAGLELNLNKHFVIGADFKYRGVRFSDEVGGLKDYSGPQLSLGFSYVLKGI
jgi:opacity protein-like surface antigen